MDKCGVVRMTSDGRPFVCTPAERFSALPDWPYEPRYFEYDGLRIHYVDEGPPDASPVLLLHGEPTWGYLYRELIAVLVEAGHRVVVPDMIGFGRSDKLTERSDYSYQMLVDAMSAFVRGLDLRDVTAYLHDWGGLVGLRVVADDPERFARLVISNTNLPVLDIVPDVEFMPNPAIALTPDSDLIAWFLYSQMVPELSPGFMVQNYTVAELPSDVVRAYDAPFPSELYRAGPRELPRLVGSAVEENREATKRLADFAAPVLVVWAVGDPLVGGLAALLPPMAGMELVDPIVVSDASHFLQEDLGPELADLVADFIENSPR